MPAKFSQELQNELIQYFEKYRGLSISDSQADEFLDSLGEFFLWINSSGEQRPPP
jgi:hypothetical protein